MGDHVYAIKRGEDYAGAQALFNKLKNDRDVVETHVLHEYLKQQGMPDEWAAKALQQIDVNGDKELTWTEFGTKGIKIVYQLRIYQEAKSNPQRSGTKFEDLEARFEAEERGTTLDESFVVIPQANVSSSQEDREAITTTPVAAMNPSFKLGEQPIWAGTEDCAPQSSNFVSDLLAEGINSINKRGYAVIELPHEVSKTYSEFHTSFESFSHAPLEYKQKYASQQFETRTNSPNQFHGFSVVGGLKEQFMMRLCGKGTTLSSPSRFTGENVGDLGALGMKLYEQLDRICRVIAHRAVEPLGIPKSKVDILLDPVNHVDLPVERDPANPEVCYSSYVPEGFISSSIMDNFHYYNTFRKEDQSDDKFYNNHAAHTDSGLLTVVVTTDVPGLEVFDQHLGQWIALEQLVHQHVRALNKSHRQFATIFWADSVAYLKSTALQPCLHRVGKSTEERYSVVFKQRTTPLTTPCRYQEDYILADIQMKATKNLNNASSISDYLFNPLVLGSAALIGAIVGTYLVRSKLLKRS